MNFLRLGLLGGISASMLCAVFAQVPPQQQVPKQADFRQLAAAASATGVCASVAAGSTVAEPEDIYSKDGVLRVKFTFHSGLDAAGRTRFCFVDEQGRQEPNLRVQPGDTVIIGLRNVAGMDVTPARNAGTDSSAAKAQDNAGNTKPPGPAAKASAKKQIIKDAGNAGTTCAGAEMKPGATNLHFHGITIPPVCHQDDVLHTAVRPGDAEFEYQFVIPKDEPPGMYWYHPHVHGSTKVQVMGGASGALIVEGIERARPELAGLPERVFVIRDQKLLNADAEPSPDASGKMPPVVLDPDGDAKNTGSGTGKPALDLSLNFVPVPYPDYPPAVITMKPGEKQLWRVLNASAITYLNLQYLVGGHAQPVGVVAVDGIPFGENTLGKNASLTQSHLGIPPGGRIEFVVTGPPAGAEARLVTRSVNTGSGGENDPTRPLATIEPKEDAPEPRVRLAGVPSPLAASASEWLGKVKPVRTRKLYFSEVLQDPKDPNSPTTFFLTVEGQTPKAFDMSSDIPNIVAKQGDVEDWIIENRSQELHAFHIHQTHFLLLEFFGLAVNEQVLRDTVNVPYWDGKNPVYPRVKLRMDFRDPSAVGLFPYHCHILEHEDSGMMGLIRVDPAGGAK
jgi:FtsP/CotA-like multicopper oxidase with cupredoxin domain